MPTAPPMISVVVPSHNRPTYLRRVLETLASQDVPAGWFEVVVVLDGYGDASLDMLRTFSALPALRIVEQLNQGPSAARNTGAEQATGDLLIFLDDDIEAAPGFIRAHVDSHKGRDGVVVIGYSPVFLEQHSFLALELRGWWEAMFRSIRYPGHRFSYSDMLSGNFSISRSLFRELGGFDLSLSVHEDYEFGMRLMAAGVPIVFQAKAVGLHHEKTDLRIPLRRKYWEGIADARLGRLHPELTETLLMKRLLEHDRWTSRLNRSMVFDAPRIGEWIAAVVVRGLPVLERMRALEGWRRGLYWLMGYWYWKGVREELPTVAQVRHFVAGGGDIVPDTEITLDVEQGVAHAEEILNRERPRAARVYYGSVLIGVLPAKPGAERLRGCHLRPWLADHLTSFINGASRSEARGELPASVGDVVTWRR